MDYPCKELLKKVTKISQEITYFSTLGRRKNVKKLFTEETLCSNLKGPKE